MLSNIVEVDAIKIKMMAIIYGLFNVTCLSSYCLPHDRPTNGERCWGKE